MIQARRMKGREGSKIKRRKKRKTKIWRRRRRTYQQNLQRKKRRRRNLIDLRPVQSLFFLFLALLEFSHFGSPTF